MLSVLLIPFSWLYGLITAWRNYLYDRGWRDSYKASDAVVICVGNLSVGGTGKTPMVEYLIRLLKPLHSVAVLSRGYGRQTQGFRLANAEDTAATLGDEPFQYFRKWPDVPVVVCEDRVLGIKRLKEVLTGVQVVILDDGFQHRRIVPHFSILLTDFSKPFFRDYLLPRGRLRESRASARRAHAVVVTKCTTLPEPIKTDYLEQISRYAHSKPVFFSQIVYGDVVALEAGAAPSAQVVLVTGLANSTPFVDAVSKQYAVKKHFEFPDHHVFTAIELEGIQSYAKDNGAAILTTEKDVMRVMQPTLASSVKSNLWFYIPIRSTFVYSGADFDSLIVQVVSTSLTHSSTR